MMERWNKTMENINDYSKKQADMCIDNDRIPKALYADYGVKKGLRDENGQGVLTGLTNISSVRAFDVIDGEKVPCDGELLYRGYDVTKLVKGAGDKRFIFEESAYLLLFGELPDATQLEEFRHIIANCMELPTNFTRDVIMKAPSADIMNSMTRSILTLASYDDRKDDLSIENVLRQSIQLISTFPMLAVYGYHAYNHYERDDSMYIHRPDKELSLAENFLRMLRPDMKYTPLETHVLDIALLLHMEHGGGNNSSFTTRVVTSSGSDTYSAIAAAMSSLKGRKHGGANLMVMNMMEDIRAHIKDYHDEEEIEHYLDKILNKEAFDKKGLIYGMGHAVYTNSDPREVILKSFAKNLSVEKGMEKEYALYETVEKEAGQLIMNKRKMFKPVCANVDFYSGFVYSMLGIPEEMFTPMFATARISGWCAHRLEELVNAGKIIRPAYKYVGWHRDYPKMEERK